MNRTIKPFLSACIIILGVCSLQATAQASRQQIRTTPLPGTVALTFDDGPNPNFTPKVLAILRANNIHATFFVMGWAAQKWPHLIKDMLKEGNVVANHTNTHKMLTRLSAKQLRYEVKTSRDMIAAVTGYAPVCLRPPFGVGNKRVAHYIRSHDMIMVPMGFNSFDYKRRGVNRLVNWVVSNAHAGQVILLHDGQKGKQQTVQALPRIIAGIRHKGLGFSVICEPRQ